ncbi:MBL fold metallo-hydrolase [bacterium]|nr:MAG: MBL fold metallo-hydrolase [bacterium]RIK65699.1 MAG: MBL fold metallo-hydrolase [Planctomycetota bacterium]
MANISQRRPENAAGPFYVDSSCIDCDACRSMAPRFYSDIGDQSAVTRQPETEAERLQAFQALLTCPTASIGCTDKPSAGFVTRAASSFPLSVAGEVYFCGYAAKSSFGATAWFVRRPDGNVLVDSPRFAAPLVRRIREMGGIRWLFLTHQDDVADHAKWAREFGCTRILHESDVHGQTRDVEMQPVGEEAVRLARDLTVIPTPGHTRGSCVLHFAGQHESFLFGGDHVAYSPSRGHLYAFRSACWYSWPEVVRSLEKLRDWDFNWVLPGHGRRFHGSQAEARASLERGIAWARGV